MEPAKLSNYNKRGGHRVGGRGEGNHVSLTPARQTNGHISVVHGKPFILAEKKDFTTVKLRNRRREDKPKVWITNTSIQERKSVRRVKVRYTFLPAQRKL